MYSTHASVGKVTKTPRITIKGSDLPRSVQISANVVANPDSTYPVAINPYKLDISQFSEKKRTEITFRVINRSEEDLAVEIIDFQKEFFSVSLPKSIKKHGEISGTVKVAPTKVGESFEKSLTISVVATTGSNKEPSRFTIPVKRTVRSLTGADSVGKAATSTGGH